MKKARIKVTKIPEGFLLWRETFGSESGARQFRKYFLQYNAGQYGTHRIKPEDVVIYDSRIQTWAKGQWEVWVRQ